MCGMARFRPPCRAGSSWVLWRALVAYKSWKAAGNGGRDCKLREEAEGCVGRASRFWRLARGGAGRSASDSESEYSTSGICWFWNAMAWRKRVLSRGVASWILKAEAAIGVDVT